MSLSQCVRNSRPPPPSPSHTQALAGELSEENRQACAETTRPLLEAVEALTTFASSPQFASTPARISAQARVAQEPIILVRAERALGQRGR